MKTIFPYKDLLVERRKKALKKLQKNEALVFRSHSEASLAIIAHQSPANFYYLTGLNEPDSIYVLIKKSSTTYSDYLFYPGKKWSREIWTGEVPSVKSLQKKTLIENICSNENLEDELDKILYGLKTIYYTSDCYALNNIETGLNLKYSKKVLRPNIINADFLLGELRLIKHDKEIKILQESQRISIKAHQEIPKKIRRSKSESDLEAHFWHHFKAAKQNMSYSPIIASGPKSVLLHYSDNNRSYKKNELILIDCASEKYHYHSDITRTYKTHSEYTSEQKIIYDIVYEALENAIQTAKRGNTLEDIHKVTVNTLTRGLLEIGLLKGKLKDIIKNKLYFDYFPHSTSHWLGLDVHDECPYIDEQSKPQKLKKGMVFTIEPGLYFSANDQSIPEEFRGIGIRLEDNIVMGPQKAINLTESLQK